MQTPQLHPKNTQLLIWPGLPKKNSLERSSYHGNAWERMGTHGNAGCPEATGHTFGVMSCAKKNFEPIASEPVLTTRSPDTSSSSLICAAHDEMNVDARLNKRDVIDIIHENCLLCPRFPDTAPKGSFYQAFIDLATFSPSQDFVGARKKPRS